MKKVKNEEIKIEKMEIKKSLYYAKDTFIMNKKQLNKRKVLKDAIGKKSNFDKFNIATFIFAIIYIIASVIDCIIEYGNEDKREVNIISNIIIAVIPLIISSVLTGIEGFRSLRYSFVCAKKEIKNDIYSKIKSNADYENNGYKWYEYKDINKTEVEKYEMSDDTNIYLVEANFEPLMRIKYIEKIFVVPSISLKCLDYKVKTKIENNTLIFNSKLVRLSSDLFLKNKMDKITTVTIQKTDYFSNIATNDAIFEIIKDQQNVSFEEYGYKYSVDKYNNDEVNLRNLQVSYCANIIGISTLAITKDNKIILLRQANCDVNSNNLAPSGSGSADFKRLKNNNFIDFLSNEMNREMLEEMQINKNNYKLIHNKDYLISNYSAKTYVIGYCRLLNRGGKPDFFGITDLDVESSIIEKYFKKYKARLEINNNSKNKIKEVRDLIMINSIYDLNKENRGKDNPIKENDGTSIQVHIICNLIEKLAKECKREELRKLAGRFCGGNILQQSLKTNKKNGTKK